MRRWLLSGVVVSTLIVGSSVGAAVRPGLRLVAAGPKVVVRGVSFRAGERVTIRVIGRTTKRATRVASPGGTFVLSMTPPARLDCGRLIVVAKGPTSGSATLRIGPPECNPAGGDLGR